MEVIPAIDLRGGLCVRFVQGDFDRETVFSNDPVATARRWAAEGATRLHVVDLEGARGGTPANAEAVLSVIEAVDLPVQVAGGVRDLDAVARWLEAGADRVVLGTAVARDPSFAVEASRRHGEAVVVSVDARDGFVAIEAWEERTELRADELVSSLAAQGVPRFVYTDVARDGTLSEPNYDAVAALAEAIAAPLIAAGGVAEIAHLVRLAELGVEGAIVGRALYDGRVSLPDALRAVGGP